MLEARISAKRLPSGVTLLRNVNLKVGPGEIVALLGASGTGKTSTLRILTGLDEHFEGTVRCTAMRVGAAFQEPRLLPWLTIADNIRLVVPSGRRMPETDALLGEVGLAGTGALYPGQMSLGMARRAALARALAITPDLLILDEPFASLDPGACGLVVACLVSLQRERGTALVIAMHDIDRATALATRIVVLAGRPATVSYQAEIAATASEAERATVRSQLIGQFPFVSNAMRRDARDGLPVSPVEG